MLINIFNIIFVYSFNMLTMKTSSAVLCCVMSVSLSASLGSLYATHIITNQAVTTCGGSSQAKFDPDIHFKTWRPGPLNFLRMLLSRKCKTFVSDSRT